MRPIISVIGQSNALGMNPQSKLPLDYLGKQDDIFIWFEGDKYTYPEEGRWENLNPVYNTVYYTYADTTDLSGVFGWSVEESCSHWLRDVFKTNVFITKTSAGGQTIEAYLPPSGHRWIDIKRKTLDIISYDSTIGVTPNFQSLIWLHGEASCYDTAAPIYYSQVQQFLDAYRSISPYTDSTQFVMVTINAPVLIERDSMAVAIVNRAFDSICLMNHNCYLIKTDSIGVTYNNDRLHYSPSGLIKIGKAWYNLIKKDFAKALY